MTQAKYYFCGSENNPYDEYDKETDMVFVSECFQSNDNKELVNKNCQNAFTQFFPSADKNYVGQMVAAESFYTLKNCEERQKEALFFAEEPYGEGFKVKTIDNRKYFLINTY